MTHTRLLKGFLVALVILVIGDTLWHSYLLGDFYTSHLANIAGASMPTGFPPFIMGANVIISFVVAYFVLGAACKHTLTEGAWHGALLGLLGGVTINFVNHSLMQGWDTSVLLVDTAWAVVLGAIIGTAITAVAGKKV